ncbi:hypothetical protein EGN72_02635 [Pseudorhodobacter sp. E13]|uniref:hypothetical protein n=1 Tax=Pseudorhodobacter sp. E13 TaxID=2487931 RepID=UPI000F8D3606|nr:hypothetical protein [Pseudorhodobacter sp. E13]RUS64908.1 hypothetical protein EGN72_02635 [Pseudorhodobacter sp. E13]
MAQTAPLPDQFLKLPDAARADLAVALLCSLTGPAGLALIFAAMAQVDAHADDLYRLEFEKEC